MIVKPTAIAIAVTLVAFSWKGPDGKVYTCADVRAMPWEVQEEIAKQYNIPFWRVKAIRLACNIVKPPSEYK